jgi:hypothetical protein
MAEESVGKSIPSWPTSHHSFEASHNEHIMLTSSADYSLANPDTLTKYKVAAGISQKVLETVTGTLPRRP